MPAFYAHYRFGKMALGELQKKGETGESLAKICESFPVQFEIGLQGPDIFFFYRPYTGGGRVAKYGHGLHKASAMAFFQAAACVIEAQGKDSAAYAYLLGFICHFALDSGCHGRIAEIMEETGVAHLEIEEELEKFLLRSDGKDPLKFPLASLVPTDDMTCRAISLFYAGITPDTVRQSLSDLRRVKKLLTAPGAMKQGAINTAFRLTGHYRQLKGLMHQRKDNPLCEGASRELAGLLDAAATDAAALMESFDRSLTCGLALSERFDRNFM